MFKNGAVSPKLKGGFSKVQRRQEGRSLNYPRKRLCAEEAERLQRSKWSRPKNFIN